MVNETNDSQLFAEPTGAGATSASTEFDSNELEDEDDEDMDDTAEIVSYKSVYAASPALLDELVNEMIDDGWDPHGSLAVLPNGALIQPMVLVE